MARVTTRARRAEMRRRLRLGRPDWPVDFRTVLVRGVEVIKSARLCDVSALRVVPLEPMQMELFT
jgi:hypothetical protein